MDDKKIVKYVGIACTLIGFGLTMVQKKLDDAKLQELIQEEVSKQLNKPE